MDPEQFKDDPEQQAAFSSDAAPDSNSSLSSSDQDNPPQADADSPHPTETPEDHDDVPSSLDDVIDAAFRQEEANEASAQTDETAPEDKDADPDPDADGKSDETAEGDPEGQTEEPDDPAEAEIAAMAPKVQKRVRQLLTQRREARKQVEALKPDADSYDAIRRYMAENDLSDPEVAELFQLGALLKSGNPDAMGKVLERLEPLVNQLKAQTGRGVPDDLRQMVETGEMTEDAARQMARTRAEASFADQRAQRATRQAQQVQTQAHQSQITQAIQGWFDQTSQTDPDFGMKSQAMQRAAQALVAERGAPRTPAEAVEYAKAAYAEVNQWFQRARPAPKPTRPSPVSNAAPRSGLAPAPTSLAGAIEQALEAAAHR